LTLPCLRVAEAADLPFLEKTEKLRLQWKGELPDLVEEERSVAGLLDQAGPVGSRLGEGSPAMTEELALEKRLRNRAAVDGDERLPFPAPPKWRRRATNSFPVPLSPVTSTVAS